MSASAGADTTQANRHLTSAITAASQGSRRASSTNRFGMEAHLGNIYRRGPSGRRAALIRGPDVWEVVRLLRSLDRSGEVAVAETASWLDLTEA